MSRRVKGEGRSREVVPVDSFFADVKFWFVGGVVEGDGGDVVSNEAVEFTTDAVWLPLALVDPLDLVRCLQLEDLADIVSCRHLGDFLSCSLQGKAMESREL